MKQNKPYYRSFSSYLKEKFGCKVFRVSLDAGFTCPNRDGTLGYGGCAYCSPEGSWNREISRLKLNEQVEKGIERAEKRYGAQKFIAYFQAFTNTYAPVSELKEIYDRVLSMSDRFVGLAIGTRPDCIDDEKLKMISEYKTMGYDVWIEYGLQSSNEKTLELINRKHGIKVFDEAVLLTKKYEINVAVHVIIGLPGEGMEDVHNTANYVADLPIDGVKLHNLNIVKNTLMAKWYRERRITVLSLDEYANLAVDFLERIKADIIVQRLVAESSRDSLIAPKWSLDKSAVINYINKIFSERNSYQGRLYKQRGDEM
ncbi:MAG: TIGR01212 family radical SAM protein [Spirochaetes bacterium]|nr:MAG: TIGR01212 family radical SAM protein [Spirochaetota bacterium]